MNKDLLFLRWVLIIKLESCSQLVILQVWRYSGYREKLDSETGFNPVGQAQLEISCPQAAAQLIRKNVCFADYFYSISC